MPFLRLACVCACTVQAHLLHAQDSAATPPLHFTEVAVIAGVDYLQHHAVDVPECLLVSGDFCEPDRMSGGAAVGDVDGDGRDDLFVTRLDAHDLLFRANAGGAFQEISRRAGLDAFDLQSNGAALGDVDNDGDLDLFVTTIGNGDDPVNGRFYLFINDGRGKFREEASQRGAALETGLIHAGFSASFGDYDLDGAIDLHLTEWLPGLRKSHNRLLRNQGSGAPGYFLDVTEVAGVSLDPERCSPGRMCGSFGFASTFTDLDGDGWPDLAIAADFGTSRLYWNNGDGTFTDGTTAAGVGTDENGMGSTFGDVDGDGDLDWFVTSVDDPLRVCQTEPCNWGSSGNRLYINAGGRTFVDATERSGVGAGFWGWGAVFLDADNDGDLDLAMVNGMDLPETYLQDPARDDRWEDDPMRFWLNDGDGRMVEVSAEVGLTDRGAGKGLLTFDYERDGDLDLFVVNNAGRPRLYRNDSGNTLDWLRVKVEGRRSNSRGLGARVTLEASPGAPAQVREIGTASHFLGQSETVAHFGLGEGNESVWRVIVEWPASGLRSGYRQLPRNTVLVAREPIEPSGGQVPGDCDQSGDLDLADGICLLGVLFLDSERESPCRQPTESGDRYPEHALLLDVNGDDSIDISDASHLFGHLLLGGSPPTLGTGCVAISHCEGVCAP